MIFNCKQCGLSKEVLDQYAGKTVKCLQCKTSVKIQEKMAAGVSRYSLAEFINKTSQKDKGEGLFELESNNMLEINLNGMMWTKLGSMIAYRGGIKFTREGVLEHGVGKFLKKAVSGEGANLTKAEGRGALYLADMGKKISIINLEGDRFP